MARVKPSIKMAKVIHKLKWAAGGEFSAHVTHEESELLLSLVEDYFKRLEAT